MPRKKSLTEAGWLSGSDPHDMLDLLRGKSSDRKYRLFACACCRRVWRLLLNDPSRNAVVIAEEYADGLRSRKDLKAARDAVNATIPEEDHDDPSPAPARPSDWARMAANGTVWTCNYARDSSAADTVARDARYAVSPGEGAEEGSQCHLIRDILGNPFRPASLDSAWLTWHDGTITRLAQAIYEDRQLPAGHLNTSRLAVLADALEDAGCTDEDILDHCRGEGPHVRGCWVVDLLLGKD
jgi:hypothetical protein